MILSVPSRLNSSAPLFIIEILFSYSISSFCFLLPNDPIYPSSFSFKCIKSFFAFYSSIRIIFQLPITIIYILYIIYEYTIFINKVCEVHVSSHVCLLSVMSIRQWAVHSEWLLPQKKHLYCAQLYTVACSFFVQGFLAGRVGVRVFPYPVQYVHPCPSCSVKAGQSCPKIVELKYLCY